MHRLYLQISFICIGIIAAVLPRVALAQVAMDPVAVPTGFIIKYHTTYYSQNGDGRCDVSLNNDVSGFWSAPGPWVQGDRATTSLVPGTNYIFTVTAGPAVDEFKIDFVPPANFTLLIEGVERNRVSWTAASGEPKPTTLKVRLQAGTALPTGQASSLRPGRVIWDVGLGTLKNGRSAGTISLRQQELSATTFRPWALNYENESSEVEVIKRSGIPRQIYVASCLVDITEDNDHAFRLKFYPRFGSQISSTKTQDATGTWVYILTGDPLFEYIIENPTYPALSAVRITKITRQGNAEETMWTEIRKIDPPAVQYSEQWMLHDWCLKPANASSVESPVRQRWTFTDDKRNELVETLGADGAVVAAVRNVYMDYDWGMELYTSTVGEGLANAVTTTYTYHNDPIKPGNNGQLQSVTTTGGSWVMYDYYDDFDRLGQVNHIYRPVQSTPATPTANVSSTHATTYDYTAGWDGKANLASSIVTTVNNTVVGKTTFDYAYETITDSSTTYQESSHADMPVMVVTRKDYSDASNYLTTVTKSFRADSDPENRFFPGLLHSVKRPDGTMSVTTYFKGDLNPGDRSVSTSTSGANRIRVTLNGVAAWMPFAVSLPNYSFGAQTAATESNFYVVNGRTIANVVVIGATGVTYCDFAQTYVGNTWVLIQRNLSAHSAGLFHQLTSRDVGDPYTNWPVVTNNWTRGRLDSTTDESGVERTFTYDDAGRVRTSTRTAGTYGQTTIAASTVTYDYDAAGQVKTQTVSGSNAETLVTSRAYDIAGRVTSELAPGLGAKQYAYSPSSNTFTTTLPSGSTIVQESHLDGSAKQVTGSAVVATYYAYDLANGYVRTSIATSNSPRYQEKWVDWLGRTKTTSRPGFSGQPAYQETMTFHPTTGQLTQVDRTGFATTRYEYNGIGQSIRTGIDVNGDGLVPASNDRIIDNDQFIEYYAGNYWLTRTESVYPTTNSGSAQEVSRTRTRLSGLTASARAEMREIDVNGNESTTITTVNPSSKLVTTTTTIAGLAGSQQTVTFNGHSISVTDNNGLTYTQGYDNLSRPSTAWAPRTGTTTATYWSGTTLPYQVTDPRGVAISTTWYDTSGRPIVSQDPLGKTTRLSYTPRGEIENRWGSGTYPVHFAYDSYGQQQTMTTYQDRLGAVNWDSATWPGGSSGEAATTTWVYDSPSGLLERKTDTAGASVIYTYNQRGQTATRKWARNITATYGYVSGTAELSGVTYSDGTTPSVSYGYNRLGQNTSVTDVTGTRILDRCTCGRLEDERLSAYFGSRAVTYLTTTSGVLGRPRGVQLGSTVGSNSDIEQTYTYTTTGRFDTLTSSRSNNAVQRTFQYGYVTNSHLIGSLTSGSFSVSRTYAVGRDLLESVSSQWSSTVKTSFTYTYNNNYQRETVVQSGEAFTSEYADSIHQIFEYNDRGELKTAAGFVNGTPTDQSLPMSARRFEFKYDAIGNRIWSNTSGATALRDGYTVDLLNQYTDRDNRTLPAGGTAAPAARVVASDSATAQAGRAGRHWGDNVAVPNSSAPFYGSFKVYAALLGAGPNGSDLVATQTRTALLAALGQHFTYDADGNLTSDGIWEYGWDAENRLVWMETNAFAVAAGVPKRRLDFTYDYADRRVQKRVSSWVSNNWSVTSQRRYVYDGWNVIAEFSVDPNTSALTLSRSYAWGLDVTGSRTAAGGVGALVQFTDHATGKRYAATYDGNGNVASVVNADNGTLAAVYEYGPFGEAVRSTVLDPTVSDQPFRFSTKAYDPETGLIYYGMRYYDPSNGRFMGRDPIGEAGGLNLYGFVGNDAVNGWDFLGMDPKIGDERRIEQSDGTTIVERWECKGGDEGCDWVYHETIYPLPRFNVNDTPDRQQPSITIPPAIINWGSDSSSSNDAPVQMAPFVVNADRVPAPNKPAPNNADCAKLRARLRRAQQMGAVSAARVLPGGMYSGGIALSSDDATSLSAGMIGALAAGAVQFYETRPVVNGPSGIQYLTNGVQAAEMFRTAGYVAGGISLVVDGKAMITATNGTDRAFAGANLATDAFLLGGRSAITALAGSAPSWLGPWGIALAGAQFGINFGTAYKLNADANEILRENAKAALETATRANATAADIQKQMADLGCAP